MSFSELTTKLASRFLQTVVVFDDEAYFQTPGEHALPTTPLTEPSPARRLPRRDRTTDQCSNFPRCLSADCSTEDA